MLKQLHIENIAVIEKTDIEFGNGFNVLTGETGAGKSIIIDSINAVLGGRTSRDIIRSGASCAKISALFCDINDNALSAVADLGIDCEDGAVLLQRELTAEGKSLCRINGSPATAAMVRGVAACLINIHGQHDNQQLLNAEQHYKYIDSVGGLGRLFDEYSEAYHAYCRIRHRVDDLSSKAGENERRADMLRFQINEISAANIRAGEAEDIKRQRDILANSAAISGGAYSAHAALSDTNGMCALDAVGAARDAVSGFVKYLPDASPLLQRLNNVWYDLEDISNELQDICEGTEADPTRLTELDDRLDMLHRLFKKYGGDEMALFKYYDEAAAELDTIDNSDEILTRLNEEMQLSAGEVVAAAKKLSAARREAAERFARQVGEELKFLDMPNVRFEVSVAQVNPNSTGADKIEFLISTNPGESPKPIAKIASGGELSRIMLAIKSVLADKDVIDTMVFDEIDTGISGRAAQKVGIKLRQTAKNRQILCVTHLAQIASMGNSHYLIEKRVENDRTYTDVSPLSRDGRTRELARIVGGSVTDANLRSAAEMLEMSERY